MQFLAAGYNTQRILWQLALGWSVLTFIILMLIAIGLDVFGVRLLDPTFRKWIYGTFLVGLLGGVSAHFLELIKINPDKTAIEVSPKALDDAAKAAYTPPPPAPPLPPAPKANIVPSAYKVYIQFAGVLRREDVVDLARKLDSGGWNVQGRDRGGERTAAAAGLNEVRCSAKNYDAAKDLARQIQAADLTGHSIGVNQNDIVGDANLEVWISR